MTVTRVRESRVRVAFEAAGKSTAVVCFHDKLMVDKETVLFGRAEPAIKTEVRPAGWTRDAAAVAATVRASL